MNLPFISDKTFKSIDHSINNLLSKGEYDNCKFYDCNFENSDISKYLHF